MDLVHRVGGVHGLGVSLFGSPLRDWSLLMPRRGMKIFCRALKNVWAKKGELQNINIQLRGGGRF